MTPIVAENSGKTGPGQPSARGHVVLMLWGARLGSHGERVAAASPGHRSVGAF